MTKISMNVTTTFFGNVLTDIRLAKEAGFDGIELQSPKLYRYLDAGYSVESLVPELDGIAVSGLGAVLDMERQGERKEEFLREVRRMCEIASALGAPNVQLCTGPVDWNVVKDFRAARLDDADPRYRGLLGVTEAEAIRATASNLRDAAAIADEFGLGVYLEPLAWAPINRCAQLRRIIEEADRPNIGATIDFWHFWTVGDTLEEVRAFPAELITAVHVSDGLDLDRQTEVPDQSVHRDVVNGGGSIPLQLWVDAVKSTGYDGWYCSEMFSTRANEQDLALVASTMRGLLQILVS